MWIKIECFESMEDVKHTNGVTKYMTRYNTSVTVTVGTIG